MTTTTNTIYKKATQLHQKKEAGQAWEAYQQLLQEDSNHLRGLLGLSRLLYQHKKYQAAIPYLKRLVQLHPMTVEIWYTLGVCYAKTGHQQAADCLKKAVQIAPSKSLPQSESMYQLAKVLRDKGNKEMAEKLTHRILQQHPNYIKALTLKGQFLQAEGKNEEAYHCFKKVTELKADKAPAHYNLACISKILEKSEEARLHFQKAIELNPHWDTPLREYALFLAQAGEAQAAKGLLKQAIKIAPNEAENHRSMAQYYASIGDHMKVIKYAHQVLKRLPNDQAAMLSIGTNLAILGAFPKAIEYFRKVVDIEKTAEHLTALADALKSDKQIEEAQQILQQALRLDPDFTPAIFSSIELRTKQCDWWQRKEDEQLWQQTALNIATSEDEQQTMQNFPTLDMNFYQLPMEAHHKLNEYTALNVKKRATALINQLSFQHQTHQHERLRIGYISPDFRHHPVGRIVQHIFKAHHRDRVEIYAYSLSQINGTDQVHQTIKTGVDHYREMAHASNLAIAQQIYQDEIDVLIDLGVYTAFARPEVLAVRPAPVQAHFLGYPNTTAADFYDYILADEQLIPNTLEKHYTEKVMRLPHAFPGAIPKLNLPTTGRAEEGIPEDAIVFAAFNRSAKYEPQIFHHWLNIVNAVPNGILWIGVSPAVQDNLTRYADEHWMDNSRVKFSDWADYPTFLHRLRLADLFLDTQHYSAGATAVASIAMGTPVLTVTADNMTARLAASVLSGAGQKALICPDLATYEQKAIELGNHPTALRDLKQDLCNDAEQLPIFDMDAFATSLEVAYQQMYEEQMD